MEKPFIGAIQSLNAETLCEELKPWQIETGKAAFLDYLYELYDRSNSEDPDHGTYTGLMQKFKDDSAEIMRASFIASYYA